MVVHGVQNINVSPIHGFRPKISYLSVGSERGSLLPTTISQLDEMWDCLDVGIDTCQNVPEDHFMCSNLTQANSSHFQSSKTYLA